MTDVHGLAGLTDRDLRIIADALEVAFDGSEDQWVTTGWSSDEVDACAKRIQVAIGEAKTW